MPRKYASGFSLLELLCSIGIILLVGLYASPLVSRWQESQQLQQAVVAVQQILFYARSLAIANRSAISLCPSSNGHKCSNYWNSGILLLNSNVPIRYFPLNIPSHYSLQLKSGGFKQNTVQIQSNGMTYTYGHLTFRSLKASSGPQYNLYFNMGLRTYEVVVE